MKAVEIAKAHLELNNVKNVGKESQCMECFLSEAILDADELIHCDWNYCSEISPCPQCLWHSKYSSAKRNPDGSPSQPDKDEPGLKE